MQDLPSKKKEKLSPKRAAQKKLIHSKSFLFAPQRLVSMKMRHIFVRGAEQVSGYSCC